MDELLLLWFPDDELVAFVLVVYVLAIPRPISYADFRDRNFRSDVTDPPIDDLGRSNGEFLGGGDGGLSLSSLWLL